MRTMYKGILPAIFALLLAACSEDSTPNSSYVMPTSRVCSDRIIDSHNPPSEVAVLGNSLLMGNDSYGLSASDSTKDYFSRIDSVFKKLDPDCVSKRIMAKHVENSLNDSVLTTSVSENILPQISSSTDLIIIQLGDNIDLEKEIDRMKVTVGTILEMVCDAAPNAKVVWVGEWYATKRKQNILEKMSQAFGAQFIDIFDLNVKANQGRVGDVTTYPDERVQCIKYKNYSVDGDSIRISFEENGNTYKATISFREYHDYADEKRIDIVGHQGIVTDAFAATHPNDEGFRLIAERILDELGF